MNAEDYKIVVDAHLCGLENMDVVHIIEWFLSEHKWITLHNWGGGGLQSILGEAMST